MSTEHCKSDLPAYVRDELSPTDRRRVESHLDACDACSRALNKLRLKQYALNREALKKATHPNFLLNRLAKQQPALSSPGLARWIQVSGVCILLGSLFFWVKQNYSHWGPGHEIPTTGTPVALSTATTASPGTALSSASVSSPMTEDAGSVKKKSTASDHEPVLVIPPVKKESALLPTNAASVPLPTEKQWRGVYSDVNEARQTVVQTAADWWGLWSAIGQPGPAPTLNFDASMVVGVFLGEKPKGYDIVIVSVEESPDAVTVSYKMNGPSDGDAGEGLTHPYHLKVVPRSSKPVTFMKIL